LISNVGEILALYRLADIKPGHPIGAFKVAEVYPEGRGGMARVVRAVSKTDKDQVLALKISRVGGPNQQFFFAAIQKEVEILQKLDHPGVVKLAKISHGKNPFKERAVEIEGNPWFFGMEVLRGATVENFIRLLGPLSLEEAAAICHKVGTTLAHIHFRGFAHNDVKPENILFRRPLKVGTQFDTVLVDFGVAAKLVKQQLDGSVVYMAPERLQEARDPDPPEVVQSYDPSKADVWSVGILFYRLLVGREPFVGITDRSITSAILRTMPAPIASQRSDIPKELDEYIIEGCLAKDPKLRVSMEEFNRVIKYYAGDRRAKRVPKARRRFFWRRG
jgi:serine/threonine-protein kinase